jgi:ferredoxin
LRVPKIEFLESPAGRAKQADLPQGGSLADLCDDVMAPIPFSCRSASCGTCHIEILEGAEFLEEPNPEERDLLDVVGGPENARFACQVRLKAGAGLVRLRSLDGG